jgi:hypothetical protein
MTSLCSFGKEPNPYFSVSTEKYAKELGPNYFLPRPGDKKYNTQGGLPVVGP